MNDVGERDSVCTVLSQEENSVGADGTVSETVPEAMREMVAAVAKAGDSIVGETTGLLIAAQKTQGDKSAVQMYVAAASPDELLRLLIAVLSNLPDEIVAEGVSLHAVRVMERHAARVAPSRVDA